jgi:hypothetical protein
MKNLMIRILLLVISIFAAHITFAQEASKVEKAVEAMVSKYEGVAGVRSMKLVKGGGLKFMKAMLNKEFGKTFMKGVTGIIVMDYSEASQETCEALHKDLDGFRTLLQDFNLNGEEEFADNDYIRCFASEANGELSDFLVAVEQGDSKAFMYMAGKIIIEE